jgi:hypothetical protein
MRILQSLLFSRDLNLPTAPVYAFDAYQFCRQTIGHAVLLPDLSGFRHFVPPATLTGAATGA